MFARGWVALRRIIWRPVAVRQRGRAVDPDTYVLALPIAAGQRALALLVFIGGLSAATGMIIVETIVLAAMASNSLVLPLLLRGRSRLARRRDLTGLILAIRRTAIAAILLFGYAYFRLVGQGPELVSIGLVSFILILMCPDVPARPP